MLLSQCTAENLTKEHAPDFDPARPTLNRDACADLARAPFQDEGNPAGLFRGSIREGKDADTEFLIDLRGAFRGGNFDDPTDFIETTNGHRSIGGNVRRMMKYLFEFGMTLDNLEEVVTDGSVGSGVNSVRGKVGAFCGQVRDPAFERCIDLALAPIALPARQIVCEANFVKCAVNAQKDCAKQVCHRACGLPIGCDSICGKENPSACGGTCKDLFCVDIGITICEPGTYIACNIFCDVFADNVDDECIKGAVDTVKCGIKDIECGIDNIKKTVELDNFGAEILAPAKKACNAIDEALAFVDTLKDPQVACAAAETQGLLKPGTCAMAESFIDTAKTITDDVETITAETRRQPPEVFVNLAFLENDLKDPAYAAEFGRQLAAKRAAISPSDPDRTKKLATIDKFAGIIDDVSRGRPARFLSPADETGTIKDAIVMGLIPVTPGKTARRILADMGPTFTQTFLPFFNTVQGIKLAPLVGRSDIDRLFTDQAVGVTLLPWNQRTSYSAHCAPSDSSAFVSPYCDVLKSFDDPNCLNCPLIPIHSTDNLPEDARFNWIPGRSVVAWNNYDSTGKTPSNVVTNFPISNSPLAYERLYKKIFKLPPVRPGFSGFEDDTSKWTSTGPAPTLNTDQATEGRGSLQVNGCGFIKLTSPPFRTADWGVVGTKLAFDLFVPTRQSNPAWVGQAQMAISIPGAGLNSVFLGTVELTPLPRGVFSTVEFPVPANVRDALLKDLAGATIEISLNAPATCSDPFLVDNLRFTGTLTNREIFHTLGSQTHTVWSNPLFGFENRSDWSSSRPLSANTTLRTQGNASLGVDATGFTVVKSRGFATTELSQVTRKLNLDVFVPKPQPNKWWVGQVQAFLTCGPLNNTFLGQQDLTNLFEGEFNSLNFDLPTNVVAVLNGQRGSFAGCSVSISVNVNAQSGIFLLDNLGFIQP